MVRVPETSTRRSQVQAYRAGQHVALQLAPLPRHLCHLVPVGDPTDVLIDDGALIEVAGHVVGGGADYFHAAGLGLMVGTGPHERGQER